MPPGIYYVDIETGSWPVTATNSTLVANRPVWSTTSSATNPLYVNIATSTPQTGSTIYEPRWLLPTNRTATATSVYHDMYMNQPLWEDAVTPQEYYGLARQRIYICRERSEAERRRLEEEERQRETRYRIAQEQYRLAGERARALLLQHLTPDQRRTMEDLGWFVVKGGKSGNRYRIHTRGYAGNVDELQGERVVAKLCCHCAPHIPLHDHHMAQKLSLEWDEDRFLRTANRTRVA